MTINFIKSLVLTASLLLASHLGFSQNLTMSQLVQVRKMNIGEITNFMTQKNWELLSASEETDDSFGELVFAYEKSIYDDKAISFLYYTFSEDLAITRVSIQVNIKSKYNEYMNAIKGYGTKYIGSTVSDKKIFQLYKGATTSFIISNGTTDNYYNANKPYWNIELRSNDDN